MATRPTRRGRKRGRRKAGPTDLRPQQRKGSEEVERSIVRQRNNKKRARTEQTREESSVKRQVERTDSCKQQRTRTSDTCTPTAQRDCSSKNRDEVVSACLRVSTEDMTSPYTLCVLCGVLLHSASIGPRREGARGTPDLRPSQGAAASRKTLHVPPAVHTDR